MTCNTAGCKEVKKFVESLMTTKPVTSWSVSEDTNGVGVSVCVGLPDDSRILRLKFGQDSDLDDSTKQMLVKWLRENS